MSTPSSSGTPSSSSSASSPDASSTTAPNAPRTIARRAAFLRAQSRLARLFRARWSDGDLCMAADEEKAIKSEERKARCLERRARCPSYQALQRGVRRLTGCPGFRSVHRLAEAAARGADVPYAALTHRALPTSPAPIVDRYTARVYGGRFVDAAGARFVTSCQDSNIRVYDTHGGDARRPWTKTHMVHCDDVRWTITDFDVSRCSRWLVYTTINQFVYIVDLENPARPHRTLVAMRRTDGSELFGVMTCMFSPNASQVIIGTTGAHAYLTGTIRVLDVERQVLNSCVNAHAEDVNSIDFLSSDDPTMLLSGSDDGFAKLWDRRLVPNNCSAKNPIARPSSTFVGHVEGLTHLSSKNDGRFLISQGKDQCIKLWDVRKATSSGDPSPPPKDVTWDYRFKSYPGRSQAALAYRDDAVMTYQGAHKTLQTLIRAYFSPLHSTGQKYIYTGSCTGNFAIYDVLTGSVVARNPAHGAPVRDVSWHPTAPLLTTVGWDNYVHRWTTDNEKPFTKLPMEAAS